MNKYFIEEKIIKINRGEILKDIQTWFPGAYLNSSGDIKDCDHNSIILFSGNICHNNFEGAYKDKYFKRSDVFTKIGTFKIEELCINKVLVQRGYNVDETEERVVEMKIVLKNEKHYKKLIDFLDENDYKMEALKSSIGMVL